MQKVPKLPKAGINKQIFNTLERSISDVLDSAILQSPFTLGPLQRILKYRHIGTSGPSDIPVPNTSRPWCCVCVVLKYFKSHSEKLHLCKEAPEYACGSAEK